LLQFLLAKITGGSPFVKRIGIGLEQLSGCGRTDVASLEICERERGILSKKEKRKSVLRTS